MITRGNMYNNNFMGKKILFFMLSCFLLATGQAYSQVGVNTENPNKLTELEITNIASGTDTVPKGIMIPRMSEKLRDLIDVNEAKTANSLLIYNLDEDCYNYYSRIEKEWQSLCGKLGKAQFTFECNDVSVKGTYIVDRELTSSHYLSIKVNVTKEGSYTIIGETSNGYGFYTTGTFLSPGIYTIMVPGQGTPSAVQEDKLLLNANGEDKDCDIKINVLTNIGTYTMSCNSAKVKGVYKVGVSLDPLANYITVPVTVTNPGSWEITTDLVDGISFYGSGTFASTGTFTVTLSGQGTPTSVETKKMTLTSNSQGGVVTTCTIDVIIVIPKKKILNIGTYTNDYSYNFGNSNRYNNKALMDQMNFGTNENSIVKMEGWELMFTGDNTPSETTFTTQLAQNPDVVLIGVWWSPTSNMAKALASYIAKGGVVLAFMEETGGLNLVRTVFANNSITQTARNAAGAVYQFAYLDDPILNGPFGDIRGLQWGEDASSTFAIGGLPSGDVNTYSTDSDISGTSNGVGNTSAFRHKTLPFVYVADGGFNSSYITSSTTAYPFISGSKIIDGVTYPNYPLPYNNYGRGTTKYSVYNSVFSLNALAWAAQYAEFYGINAK